MKYDYPLGNLVPKRLKDYLALALLNLYCLKSMTVDSCRLMYETLVRHKTLHMWLYMGYRRVPCVYVVSCLELTLKNGIVGKNLSRGSRHARTCTNTKHAVTVID